MAKVFDEDIDELILADAFIEQVGGALEGGGQIAVGEGIDEIEDELLVGQAEHLLEDLGGEWGLSGGEQAVEQGQAVAHGAVGESGDLEEDGVVGLDFFLVEDVAQVFGDLFGGDIAEIEALAA